MAGCSNGGMNFGVIIAFRLKSAMGLLLPKNTGQLLVNSHNRLSAEVRYGTYSSASSGDAPSRPVIIAFRLKSAMGLFI